MIIQAGDSEEGREFAAATADAIFSRYGTLEAGQAFYTDVNYDQRHDMDLNFNLGTVKFTDREIQLGYMYRF